MPAVDIVVLCGGKGVRLGALTVRTPKPLLPVGGAPFLLHRLQALQAEGKGRIILAVHYLAEQFRAFARTHAAAFPNLAVMEEPTPLGTGGALRYAITAVETEQFVALNGDSWLEQPLGPVVAAHQQTGAAFTMVVVPAANVEGGAHQKGFVSLGPNGRIAGFETPEVAWEGWINAGCYVIEKRLVQRWPDGRYDLERDFLSLVPRGGGVAYHSASLLLDIGTPACYARAQQAFAAGAPALKERVFP